MFETGDRGRNGRPIRSPFHSRNRSVATGVDRLAADHPLPGDPLGMRHHLSGACSDCDTTSRRALARSGPEARQSPGLDSTSPTGGGRVRLDGPCRGSPTTGCRRGRLVVSPRIGRVDCDPARADATVGHDVDLSLGYGRPGLAAASDRRRRCVHAMEQHQSGCPAQVVVNSSAVAAANI